MTKEQQIVGFSFPGKRSSSGPGPHVAGEEPDQSSVFIKKVAGRGEKDAERRGLLSVGICNLPK